MLYIMRSYHITTSVPSFSKGCMCYYVWPSIHSTSFRDSCCI